MSIAPVKNLVVHLDDRGYLYEILRCDDSFFTKFGQVYVSVINPGVVKGFYKHSQQTEHITCVLGQVKLVLVGEGEEAGVVEIEEHHLSPLVPKVVIVEPKIWYGWCPVGGSAAMLINITDTPFDSKNPDGVRINPHSNPWGYTWKYD